MGCWKMFPNSKSCRSLCSDARAQQVRGEGACAGEVEREVRLRLLPASRADKSCPSSSPPAGPAPPLSRWTAAIFQHQPPDTMPCPSWLNCSQTGNSGTVPAVSFSRGDYPSGLGAEPQAFEGSQSPVPSKAASSRLAPGPTQVSWRIRVYLQGDFLWSRSARRCVWGSQKSQEVPD